MFEEMKGKTLFVTGAASGMGRAVAVRFGALGCKVAVAARKPDAAAETVKLVEQAGGQAIFVPCDVADETSVKAAIDTTVKTFGSLDYAFNNAGCGADGVHIPFAPLTEVTEADWLKVIGTNLTGMFHCLKYELIQMNKQGSGAIVNTSSIGGLHMTPGFGAYGPSKAGVIAITQTAEQRDPHGQAGHHPGRGGFRGVPVLQHGRTYHRLRAAGLRRYADVRGREREIPFCSQLPVCVGPGPEPQVL